MDLTINKTLRFIPATAVDLAIIFDFYAAAIAHQKKVFNKHWQGFDKDMIVREIAEQRQWKILSGEDVVCIFAIDFNDAAIWREKDKDPSIYLHRIVTHPEFRGNNYVIEIMKWAIAFGSVKDKKYVRMDTWGDNPKLIAYYTKCGFEHVGIVTPDKNADLPKHYNSISLALFEILILPV